MIHAGEFLAANGLMLFAGATAWLGTGAIVGRLMRSPVRRQRAAEMTLLCTLVWSALACLPLPRWSPPTPPSQTEPALVSIAEREAPDPPAGWQAALASVSRQPAEGDALRPPGAPLPVGHDDSRPDAAGHPKYAEAATAPSAVFTAGVADRLATVYLICAAGCAAWLLLGHVMLWRLVRFAKRPEAWLLEMFDEVCAQVGVPRPARLLVVRSGVRPASCGLVRPTVLLGEEDCRTTRRSRLRQVLLHEAAHLRQRDAWGNALFNFAMPLLWLHPLYWVIWSQASLARELVADDVAAACSGSRTAYASDLLELASLRLGYRRPAPLAALGILRSPSHFYRRLHMLVHRDTRLESRCPSAWKLVSGAAFAVALVAASATFGVRPATAAADAGTPASAQAAAEPSQPPAAGSSTAFDLATFYALAAAPEADTTQASRKYAEEIARLKAELASAQDNVERLNRELERAAPTRAGQAARMTSRRASLGHITFRYEGADAGGAVLALDGPTKKLMWRLDVPLNADSFIRCYDDQTLLIKSADGYTRLVTAEDGKVIRAWAPGVEAPAASSEPSVNPFTASAGPAKPGQPTSSAAAAAPAAASAQGLTSAPGTSAAASAAPSAAPTPTPSAAAVSAGPALTPTAAAAAAPSAAPAVTAAPAARPAESESLNAAVGSLRPQLDLVALADRYADAVAAMAVAREDLSNASADPRERAAAKARFIAAERKTRLFRDIAEAALAQAERENAIARKRVEQGVAPADSAAETEGRVRILSLILKSGSDNTASPSDGQRP